MPRDYDWHAIRTAYEQSTETLDIIADRFGLSKQSIFRKARLEGWTPRTLTAAEKQQLARNAKARAPDLTELIMSVQRTTARVVAAMEARLGMAGEGITEGDLKALSALAGTLTKVMSLEPRGPRDGAKNQSGDEPAPDDAAMLARLVALAERFVETRAGGRLPDGADAADAPASGGLLVSVVPGGPEPADR